MYELQEKRMKKPVLMLITGAITVISLAAVPVAQAKVPRGKYRCYQTLYQSGTFVQQPVGGFRLKPNGKYSRLTASGTPMKGKGKYKVKGKNVTFKTGPYHTFTGKAGKASDGTPDIVITLKSNHGIYESCFLS